MVASVSHVSIEHHAPGRLGIGEAQPRLSWQVVDAPPEYRQQAVRIEVTRGIGADPSTSQTHEMSGDQQILVDWPFAPLSSREWFSIRVQVGDGERWSPWSLPVGAEAGLLESREWGAQLISPSDKQGPGPHRIPGRLRREFRVDAAPVRARLYLTGHGVVQAEINGVRVGDEELTPGWTSYRHRLRYATFDVTDLLAVGDNAVGIWLGDGWWRGRLGYAGGTVDFYGADIAAAAQLEIEFPDGDRHTVATDGSWLGGPGPINHSDLYDGESFDLRRHDPRWSCPGFVDPAWAPVSVTPLETDRLVAPNGPPVRVVEEIAPRSVTARPGGRWVLDFGQNHSGRLRLRVTGEEGRVIRLRHAEVLQDGDVFTEPLRTARATDELILAGGMVEWSPRFTIHGYRYVEVDGWPGEIEPGAIVSQVMHSDMQRTGWFSSSHELVDRLHENVVWSLRSNFVDLPTDCPQRDERLGWTGDIQVFAPSATFLYDVTGFLDSWLQDLAAEQAEFDWVPPFVPYLPLPPWTHLRKDAYAVWSDAALLTPEALFQETGDTGLLRQQFDSALRFMRHVEAGAPDLICEGTEQLGDWLDPNAPADEPMKALTSPVLVATAYFAHSARRMAEVAAVLGEDDIAEHYAALAPRVARAYAERFIGADGTVEGDTQTAYAITTAFDLWPDDDRRQAGASRLAQLVREAGGRVSTGFAGTPLITDALTMGGDLAEAYSMIECTKRPSWLYAVLNGGTTIWERWDALLPDGTVYPGNMTSFNHYALGSVASWLHRVVAGVAPAEPGWRRIRFAPRPGGTFRHASAKHLTPYGPAAISWHLQDDDLHVTVTVPTGADASLDIPGHEPIELGHGTHTHTFPAPTDNT